MLDIPPLLIRADAGGTIGTGHVMRMIALSHAWQDRGGAVTLAACQCPPQLVQRIEDENISFVSLGDHLLGGEAELAATVELARNLGARWVVIDGYHFREEYHKSLKANGLKVLAVDDYGHCETWYADLVLNQNIGASINEKTRHENGRKPTYLLGVRYALLRREFRIWKESHEHGTGNETRILITFGGVDPKGATLRILDALTPLSDLRLHVKVLAGPANPGLEEIKRMAALSPHHVEIIPSTRDMPALYAWADRVISAGGSSCYEWMFFHLPGWVTSIAENQDEIVRCMITQNLAAGIQRIFETGHPDVSASLGKWLEDTTPLSSSLIDGHGAPRVAAELSEVRCWLRPVTTESDTRFLFDLANDPAVRRAGRHTESIPWEDHLAWLRRHCASEDSHLQIIEQTDHGPAGLVRMHKDMNNLWEIGISIHPDFRKLRLASTALSMAMRGLPRLHEVAGWKAQIRDWNHASQGLMQKLGLSLVSEKAGMQTWILEKNQIE